VLSPANQAGKRFQVVNKRTLVEAVRHVAAGPTAIAPRHIPAS
jgi:hypothetical protein